ncbi:hypothetical protein AB0L33_24465 [Streptomyces sp. NPDC052299]|uniref:hypothetical protein n=1 Tax=Streptomyces sp. NPDC052299 TaxID=3155054 RepID=UPI00343ED523
MSSPSTRTASSLRPAHSRTSTWSSLRVARIEVPSLFAAGALGPGCEQFQDPLVAVVSVGEFDERVQYPAAVQVRCQNPYRRAGRRRAATPRSSRREHPAAPRATGGQRTGHVLAIAVGIGLVIGVLAFVAEGSRASAAIAGIAAYGTSVAVPHSLIG